MVSRYKSPTPVSPIPSEASSLPIDKPIAVYYRQSTDAQVGNISTTIQTVDMVEYLKRRGWCQESW